MAADDNQAIRAAAFLARALALPATPEEIALDLERVAERDTGPTFAVELDSSVGPAAFLIYVYELAADGAARATFNGDLGTLEDAAERGGPGPRIVAHLDDGAFGFILATAPATARALLGAAESTAPVPEAAIPRSAAEGLRQRAEAAGQLLRLLTAANAEAVRWLAAAETAGSPADSNGPPTTLDLTPEETALALLLLDDAGVRALLRTMNAVLAAAGGRG
ncbi:MAG: hypothetical protein AVDCRST_MAG73-3702 [uncultured Thermomicrobiales bacterium]|uniref:Uncharacterized protein n=1 Tax=uncultured Thermomicrobiales bacterium TaxID=1645740 RepID=A0A6J4UWA9_9BACT|nr:MAG: hypothetical protein AVDCRST_MAG73-3702 [uncultured Thermomicrobiales bacterium]